MSPNELSSHAKDDFYTRNNTINNQKNTKISKKEQNVFTVSNIVSVFG